MSEIDQEKEQKSAEEESATNQNSDVEIGKTGSAEPVTAEGGMNKPFANALDWVNSIVFAAVTVLLLSLFVSRSVTVSGTSMCNTLQDGDMVLAGNFLYTPQFGDVVVVRSDKLVNKATGLYGEPLIKRVIGVEGDVIRFDFAKGEVYRNGKLLDEEYIAEPTRFTGASESWCKSGVDYVVPENCIFVMGDNRNVSHDSRDLENIGFVDTNYIMGRAFVRFSPISKFKWL